MTSVQEPSSEKPRRKAERAHVRDGAPRRPRPGQSLAERAPEVARDWDVSANGGVLASQVPWRSNVLASWACHRCGHRVENTIAGRTQISLKRGAGYGCRRCSIGRRDKPRPGKSLAEVWPDRAAEFDLERNAPLTPADLTTGSSRQMYWRCTAGLGHDSYLQMVSNRRKSGCPACADRVVTSTNSLQAVAPGVAAQWHPTKNGARKPSDIVAGSNQRVWWRCVRGHEWQAYVGTRVHQRTRCPHCSQRHRSKAEVALFAELHEVLVPRLGAGAVRRDQRIGNVAERIGRCDVLVVVQDHIVVVEYDGAHWHDNRIDADRRKGAVIRGAGHGMIRVREVPLGVLHEDDVVVDPGADPHIVAVTVLRRMLQAGWLPVELTREVEDYAVAGKRLGTGLCATALADVEHVDLGADALAVTHPQLAEQWDSAANGDLTPRHVSSGSYTPRWWTCPSGDAYQAPPAERVRGRGCPVCSGKQVTSRNSLATCRPDIATEYSPGNPRAVDQVVVGSHAPVMWCCTTCTHEWKASVASRTRLGAGCPACAGKVATATANLAAVYPAVAATWHPERNRELRPDQVRPRSSKTVWWLCPSCDKPFEGQVSERAIAKFLCCGTCARFRTKREQYRKG
ncbi:zinc-ribbon domain-containing protein [Streptomyces leeuwenhoekii]|uniref:zinc-ribbon domain-containing protein n=1 Tax=Streptomyces leeuwenhoekii TaxID=1437453 RepID=UPI0036AD2F18